MISEQMKIIVHYIKNELDNKMKEYNLTAVQFMILEYLYINKDRVVIQKEICDHLSLKHSTVIGILNRLELKKLIKKKTKQNAVITINKKGIELLEKIGIKEGFIENKLLDGFTEEEKEVFSQQLDRMYNNIKDNI